MELATLEWVAQPNNHSLLEPIGYIHLWKLRQTTTGNSPVKPPQWQPDLNQTASTNPGEVSPRVIAHPFTMIVDSGSSRPALGAYCRFFLLNPLLELVYVFSLFMHKLLGNSPDFRILRGSGNGVIKFEAPALSL